MSTLAEISGRNLAILGGPKAIPNTGSHADMFRWPIVTKEDEQAVVQVLRSGTMSALDVTRLFEAEFAAWQGSRFALAHCNGTAALLAAMYAVGLRRGDELICPSITYWASALQAFSLGATVVFADVKPHSICIDPRDLDRRISRRTRAIMVVHAYGHPADMDPILAIARKHGLKVIEDVSHAHGALYKGRKVGTFGDVAAMSMMGSKSFAIGEAGMLVTDNRAIYERAVAFAHYERHADVLTLPELKGVAGLPLGGVKGRINQTCSAMGRVQLKYYDHRMAEIQKAMNRFWDLLEGTPGLRAHRPAKGSGSTMGGWYAAAGLYVPEELGDLPAKRFVEAVAAEGAPIELGVNLPLHEMPLFNIVDVYGDGKPTRIAFAERDVRQAPDSLPVAHAMAQHTYRIPWFKHDRPEVIERYAAAFHKVAMQHKKLL